MNYHSGYLKPYPTEDPWESVSLLGLSVTPPEEWEIRDVYSPVFLMHWTGHWIPWHGFWWTENLRQRNSGAGSWTLSEELELWLHILSCLFLHSLSSCICFPTLEEFMKLSLLFEFQNFRRISLCIWGSFSLTFGSLKSFFSSVKSYSVIILIISFIPLSFFFSFQKPLLDRCW